MPDDHHGYRLEFADDFRGAELDRSKWLPHYLPQWSSRAASAARYRLTPEGLELTIAPEQRPWCPEFDGAVRVSSLQTGVRSGLLGFPDGQHRFNPQVRVREIQAEQRLYVPLHGRFELRARLSLGPGQLGALWAVGFEDRPERSGEITIMEIFGDTIDADGAVLGYGIKQVNDPALTTEFHQDRLAFDPAQFHLYAAEWSPAGVDFFLDGRRLRRSAQSPAYPMQFMLNVYELSRRGSAAVDGGRLLPRLSRIETAPSAMTGI